MLQTDELCFNHATRIRNIHVTNRRIVHGKQIVQMNNTTFLLYQTVTLQQCINGITICYIDNWLFFVHTFK